MRRGDIAIVSAQGDYGKPRPAVVIQSDALAHADGFLACLLTSEVIETPLFRLAVLPSEADGLKLTSQIMVDKIVARPRAKCSRSIGGLDKSTLIALNHMLAVMIGIPD